VTVGDHAGSAVELLGRDPELRALHALVDDPDRGGVAVVHGAPGIGKTAVLAAVAAHARSRGCRVLATAGVASEALLPYAALERLLRGLLDGADALPAPQRAALLGGLGLADAAVPDVFLIGLATLNLLAGAADGGRLVALVDDAQWLDEASAEVLAFAGRRLAAEPVVLVVARRDPPPAGDALAPVLDIALEPLDGAAAGALVARTASDLPAAARRRLLEVGAGNPLALIELPLAPPARYDGEGPEVPLTARLERAFAAQADALPATTRALLRVAAVDDGDAAPEILAAARRLDAGVGDPDLDLAVEARLLERDGGRLRFRHPLVRFALHQAAAPGERRAAHAAIAAVATGDPHRRAWHRAAAATGPDDAVADALAAAAADARRRGAVAAAMRALARSAALTTAREQAVDRLVAAADLAAELGDTAAAADLAARAEALGPGPAARVRIRLLREPSADGADDPVLVRALLEDAAWAQGEGDLDTALRLLLAAATRCWWSLPAGSTVREAVAEQALRAPLPADEPRLLAVLAAASADRHAGHVVEWLERACAVPGEDAAGAHLLGQAAHMVGASELAVRQLARVEASWRAQGRLALLAQALVMRAWSTVQLGAWPVAESAAAEGERLARETGQPLWAAGGLAALAAAAGARGETARATTLAAAVEAELVVTAPGNLLTVLQVARGVTALGARRFSEAYDELARLFDPADPAHHYAERHGGLSYLAEAALHSGRVAEARAVLARTAPHVGAAPASLARVGIGVARPLLDPSDDAFAAALGDVAIRHPFHRGRLLLAQGAWLRRSRRPAESRAPLRTARDLFDALGVVPWAERAREELRASGETSRRRVPDAREELTPQERQVTRLAASGLSNPEIGERLFLSPRTVASHLYRAFPKLGIASRRELGEALADDVD
jgi:DNA-binding CsgD family transcriptional regulator